MELEILKRYSSDIFLRMPTKLFMRTLLTMQAITLLGNRPSFTKIMALLKLCTKIMAILTLESMGKPKISRKRLIVE